MTQSSGQTTITVVVCTYNRARLVSEALSSLAAQTLDPEQAEILIVDNNSTDNTAEVVQGFCERFPNFRLLHEPNQGLSYARNRGWQEARGEWVAFLDDDACAEPDWCERIVTAFRTINPTPVSVGGPIFPWYETDPPGWYDDQFEIRSWGDAARFLREPWEQYGFSGSNMAFPRTVLERQGGFRVDMGMSGGELRLGEESDLFYRLYQRSPHFWYDPSIKVRHWVPRERMSVRYLLRRSFRAGQSRAMIVPCRVFSRCFWREVLGVLTATRDLLAGIFPVGAGTRARAVSNARRVLNQVGYLLSARWQVPAQTTAKCGPG